ncbi:MAG: hypothetical protein WKF73_12620 [Nocardioidaceae bacterium]
MFTCVYPCSSASRIAAEVGKAILAAAAKEQQTGLTLAQPPPMKAVFAAGSVRRLAGALSASARFCRWPLAPLML